MEEDYFDVGEGKIFYHLESGQPVVVYLHGFVGNMTALKRQREYFSQLGFGELAIDIRGNGKSFKPKRELDYRIDKYLNDLERIVENKKIEKFHLLGHSMGAMIAQAFAIRYPEKVTSLILIGSFFSLPLALGWRGKLLSLLKFTVKPTMPFLDLIGRSSHASIHYPDFSVDYAETTEWRKLSGDIYNHVRSFGSAPLVQGSVLLRWNTEEILKQIEVPTLLIHGSNDDIIPVRMAYKLKDLIPSSKLMILDGGHMVQASNPKKVNQTIEEFLTSL